MGVFDIIGGFSGGGIGSLILGVINVLVGLLLLGSPSSQCRWYLMCFCSCRELHSSYGRSASGQELTALECRPKSAITEYHSRRSSECLYAARASCRVDR